MQHGSLCFLSICGCWLVESLSFAAILYECPSFLGIMILWLFLLQLSSCPTIPLCRTSLVFLTIASLKTPDSSTFAVWRYNGEIDYATGFHIALIVVALVFWVFLFVSFTLVLISAQVLQRFDLPSKLLRRLRLDPFIKVYQVPFKPAHRYWIGLCLLMRFVLLILFATLENDNASLLAMINFCVISLSLFGTTGGVYEKHWQNILEMSFILNLGTLAAARLYLSARNSSLAHISVTIAFVTFVGIVLYHIFKRLNKLPKVAETIKKIKNRWKLITKRKKRNEVEENTSLELQELNESPVVELREPLLESHRN